MLKIGDIATFNDTIFYVEKKIKIGRLNMLKIFTLKDNKIKTFDKHGPYIAIDNETWNNENNILKNHNYSVNIIKILFGKE